MHAAAGWVRHHFADDPSRHSLSPAVALLLVHPGLMPCVTLILQNMPHYLDQGSS